MRRYLANRLILLAYALCPEIPCELGEYVSETVTAAGALAAEQAAHEAITALLQHQQWAARLAARQ